MSGDSNMFVGASLKDEKRKKETSKPQQKVFKVDDDILNEREKFLEYLDTSDYIKPPLPEDLNQEGEPSQQHLYFHGGALKKGRSGRKYPMKIDLHNLDLSFGGCGFLGIYHIGVAAAFKHYVPDCRFNRLCGTSAGAIAAAAILAEVPFCEMANHMIHGAVEARQNILGPWTPGYLITKVLTDSLYRLLPSDIHLKANGKLFISVTKTNDTMENSVVSQFVSKEDLIKVISASAFIPFFSGTRPIRHRNQGCIDGGLTSNLLNIFRNTITVSPFAGSAIISPLDHSKTRSWEIVRYHFADQGSDITVANLQRLQKVLYPPPPEALGEILEAGFRDGHRFLRRYGIARCSQCLFIRSELKPTSKMEPVKCKDGIACDKYNEKHVRLPASLESVVNKHVNHTKNFRKEYNSSTVVQIVQLLFTLVKHNPVYSFARFSFGSYFGFNKYVFLKCVNYLPFVTQINSDDVFTVETVETMLGSLLAKIMFNDVESVPSGKEFIKKNREIVRNVEVRLTKIGVYEDENPAEPLSEPHSPYMSDDEEESESESEDEESEEEIMTLKYESTDNFDGAPHGFHYPHEAFQMQSESLLAASRSTCTSANVSRVVSRHASRRASCRASAASSVVNSRSGSRRNSESSLASNEAQEQSTETFENIYRISESQDAAVGYYYETNQGDLVTFNMYDVSKTDPDDIIGDDLHLMEEDGSEEEGARLTTRPDEDGVQSNSRAIDPRQVHDLLRNVPRERFVTLVDDGSDYSGDTEDES